MVFKKEEKAASKFPRYKRENSYTINRLISVVGIIMVCGLLIIIGAQHIRHQQVKNELKDYEFRIKEHEEFQEAMEKEIERLQDLDYIEVLARKRLGLVKPGETIFQLED